MKHTEQILINGIKIDFVRKSIKNMHLSVHPPDGRVRLAVPVKINSEVISAFIKKKISWILKHQKRFNELGLDTEKEYKNGEIHLLFGQSYPLEVINVNKPAKAGINKAGAIELRVIRGAAKNKRRKVLNEWYRSELKKQISSLIEKWEHIIGVKVNDFGVKQMKTRWGTCNSRAKRIWLNLELAKKPVHCLEYIIVHEMVHFLERGHNNKFKAYMDKFMPDWKMHKKELNSRFLTAIS